MTTRKIAVVGASVALSAVLIASAPAGPRHPATKNRVVPAAKAHAVDQAELAAARATAGAAAAERRARRGDSRTGPFLIASLGERELTLHLDGKRALTTAIAIGSPESPTPIGIFRVTQKLDGRPWDGAYGCCILAINARQTRLPAGWRGGDRVAIHGTSEPGTIGLAVTAGCLRAADRAMRRLMELVPVGTPVVVRP